MYTWLFLINHYIQQTFVGISLSHLNSVFIIQKWAITSIFNLNFQNSCRNSFTKNNMKLINDSTIIYSRNCFVSVKKNLNLFEKVKPSRKNSTRNNDMFQYSIHRWLVYEKRSYNAFPKCVRDVEDVIKFTNNLKNVLILRCPYTLEECF